MNDIILGDSYELIKTIPDKSIDLILTDPPYEIVKGGGRGAFGSKNRSYHKQVSENEKLNCGISNELLEEMCRVMKKINIYLWCNKNQLRQYLDFFGNKGCNLDVLTWHKSNPVPMCNNKYLSDTEYCVFARAGGVKLYGNFSTKRKWYVTQLNKKDKTKYKHPTIKPLEIIKNLVINSSLENEVVLDPFAGSGTTLVACKELNRKYIGFEINENYVEVCKKRLNEERNEQISLFDNNNND